MKWGAKFEIFESQSGRVAVNAVVDQWCLLDGSHPTLATAVEAVLDHAQRPQFHATIEWLENLRAFPEGGSLAEVERWVKGALTIPSSRLVGRVSLEIRLLGELRLSGAILWPAAARCLPHPVQAAADEKVLMRVLAGMTSFETVLVRPARHYAATISALMMSCSPMTSLDHVSEPALLKTLEVMARSEHARALGSHALLDLFRRLEGQKRNDGSIIDLALDAEQMLRDMGVRRASAPRYGTAASRPDSGPWVDAFERISHTTFLKTAKQQHLAHRLWLEYAATLGRIPLPIEVTRADHIEGPRGFKEWLRGRVLPDGASFREALAQLSDLCSMLCDEGHMDENPVWTESDLPPTSPANNKSNKAVVPREVLSACTAVVNELLEHARRQFEGLSRQRWKPAGHIPAGGEASDEAARGSPLALLPTGLLRPQCFRALAVTLRGEDGAVVCVLNPVLPTILLWLLKAPHRTFQARMVDSGEGDELIPELSFVVGDHGLKRTVVSWLPNTHPLATRGRRQGVIREIEDRVLGRTVLGVFLNTNKTRAERDLDGGDPGLEVPWDDPDTHRALYELRVWQQRCNEVDRLLARDDLQGIDTVPSDGLRGTFPGYAYLFRHAQDDDLPGRHEPPAHAQISKFFRRVLDEAEARLVATHLAAPPGKERRAPPKIILSREATGMPDRCIFSLHSLRVTGITTLLEAGVPFWMVSKLVAGHATWLMTLHYTKPSAATVWDAVRGAVPGAPQRDAGDACHDVSAMSQEELRRHMVSDGHPMAGRGTQVAGFWRRSHDGVCPTGETLCHEGGPRIAGSKDLHGPVEGGARNCALCRFFLTGPSFIEGQVDVANATLHIARRRAEGIRDLHVQRRAPENKGRRALFDDRVERAEAELHLVVRGIHARMRLIHSSLALSRVQEAGAAGGCDGGQGGELLLTRMTSADIDVRLREASELGALDQVSRIAALVPELDVQDAPIARNELLDRLLDANGFEALLYRLPAKTARAVGDAITDGVRAQAPAGVEPDAFLDQVALGRSELFGLDLQAIQDGIARAAGSAIRITPRPAHAQVPSSDPGSTAVSRLGE